MGFNGSHDEPEATHFFAEKLSPCAKAVQSTYQIKYVYLRISLYIYFHQGSLNCI